jgi:hypothetical protein
VDFLEIAAVVTVAWGAILVAVCGMCAAAARGDRALYHQLRDGARALGSHERPLAA